MKTAVIIPGQMRTFEICYPNQRWMIYRHYPEIEFFVYCEDDIQAPSAKLLEQDYDNVHIEHAKKEYNLPDVPVSASYGVPYACSVPTYQVVAQLWINNQAWRYFLRESVGKQFDTIIRMRPDLYFHRFIPPRKPEANECYAPWWGKFGGMNDRFAVMGEKAAEWYFNVFLILNKLLKEGCPFHPETMLARVMDQCAVRNTLMTEFSTVRMDGEVRKPEVVMADVLEILQSK